jgi:hypothetical protein
MKQLVRNFTFIVIIFTFCTNRSGPVNPRNNPFDEGSSDFVYRFSAVLYMPDGKTPAPDARIAVFTAGSSDMQPVFTDTTDSFGIFDVTPLPEGTYNLFAKKDSFRLFYDSLVIASTFTTLHDDTLEKPSSLSGIVASELLYGKDSLQITMPGTGKNAVTIAPTGEFTVTGLSSGTWPVLISDPETASLEVAFSVDIAGEGTDLRIVDTIRAGFTRIHPVIGNYHVYYGSLHNHSLLSDGYGSADEAYRYARYQGKLDFFSLSDHAYTLVDAEWAIMKTAADNSNEDDQFVALWGFEWTSSWYGHCTVTGTGDFTSARDEDTKTFADFCRWLSSRDGIAFVNHPRSLTLDVYEQYDEVPTDRMVGIELWNKTNDFSWYYYNDGLIMDDNQKGYYDELLSRGWKIGALGSDDNHYATWGTWTDFRMAILAPRLRRDDVMTALRSRRFYSTLDKNIALSFTIDGKEMGSTVSGNRHTLRVQAYDMDNELFTEVIIFDKNHDMAMDARLNTGAVDISQTVTVGDDAYYYVKVTQEDGDEAISSPVWVENTGTIE